VEIKLELFADDLTGFLKNDFSLAKCIGLVEVFRDCFGLRINPEKTEVLLLGNRAHVSERNYTEINNLKIKHSVKILGVHFTYDLRVKRKLNFDEVITSIRQKLRIWRWSPHHNWSNSNCKNIYYSDFPMQSNHDFSDQKFVKEVNKIIFEFIWKGKDKVKRFVLVSDIEVGVTEDLKLHT